MTKGTRDPYTEAATSSAPAPPETLTGLCQAIEREHKAAQNHYEKACEHAFRCGQYLLKVKSKARRGDWLGFISRNFTFSQRTAQLYMRVARNPQRVAGLSLRDAQKVLAAPRPDPKPEPEPAALRTKEEWAGKINESWREAKEAGAALGESIAAAKEDLEPEPERSRKSPGQVAFAEFNKALTTSRSLWSSAAALDLSEIDADNGRLILEILDTAEQEIAETIGRVRTKIEPQS